MHRSNGYASRSSEPATTDPERRADTRLRLPDMQIRARRRGFNKLRGYEECIPIDLSTNGLALRSATLDLELLEKADVVLTVNQRKVRCTGLVCYKSDEGNLTQYGLLLIYTSRAIESVLECHDTNQHHVLEFARKTAEFTALRIDNSSGGTLLDTYRRLLCDAAETFGWHLARSLQSRPSVANRRRIPSIDDFLKINRETGTVRFQRTLGHGSIETVTIQVTDVPPGKQPSYIVQPGETLVSVYEVIEFIGEAYASMVK